MPDIRPNDLPMMICGADRFECRTYEEMEVHMANEHSDVAEDPEVTTAVNDLVDEGIEPAQASSNPPTTSINEILEHYKNPGYINQFVRGKGITNDLTEAKTALYTLIASVRPKERPQTKYMGKRHSLIQGYNNALQDYDNAIKEILGNG